MAGLLSLAVAAQVSLVSCGDENKNPTPSDGIVTVDDDIDLSSANIGHWTAYAEQVALLLANDASQLYKAWSDAYNGGEAYASSFKNLSGDYTSGISAVQQIIEGCMDIASEVGTAKIGEPFDLWASGQKVEAVYAVESWYSWHSRDDYSNNIVSILNSYYGSLDGSAAEHSISKFVAGKDAALDAKVTGAISGAKNAILAIPQPFRNNIGSAEASAAMTACADLNSVLENELLPFLVRNAGEDEYKLIIANYVDEVVLPTYKELVAGNAALLAAVQAVKASPSDESFKAAASAWLAARKPWETSEAFLFGPVGDLGLDPNMDSWPLDQEAIKNIISKGDFQELSWTGDYISEDDDDLSDEAREQAGKIAAAQNVRGFHTLEYLIFKNGEPRSYSK